MFKITSVSFMASFLQYLPCQKDHTGPAALSMHISSWAGPNTSIPSSYPVVYWLEQLVSDP